MNVSEFLVEHLDGEAASNADLHKFKHKSRELISVWWEKNKDYAELVKNNFESCTKLKFSDYESCIMTGIADHYAEKAFIAGNPDNVRNHFKKISYNPTIVNELKEKNKKKNILLMTLHSGGVEAMPTSMGFLGLHSAVFVNYKTTNARNGQINNAKQFGVRICDVKGNLRNDLLHFRNHPHVSMLVCDAFDYWKRSEKSMSANIFSKECKLDNSVDYFAKLLNADIYFAYMKRTGLETYEFIIEPVEPIDRRYNLPIMKKFEHIVLNAPTEYYAWSEMHELFNLQEELC